MKILISESKLKNFFKNRFDFDLTGKIKMITSTHNLPEKFKFIDPQIIRTYLNKFGPIFIINFDGRNYLYQSQEGNRELVADEYDRVYPINIFMDILGISGLGLRVQDLIDIYFEEESIN